MKYFKKKTGLWVLVAAVSVFTGCNKDFLDINDNPNVPTDDNITPELIFNRAAVASAQRQASGNFRFLNSWMGYFSAAGDFAIVQDETTYNVDFSFSDNIWGNHYDVLFDLYQAKTKALVAGDTVLAGASMVLSAKLWQELVDIFGNIPFSQAFQTTTTRTPAYDDDAAIYAELQKMLDTAKTYLSKTARLNFNSFIGAVIKIGPETLGSGNVPTKQANWVKFANTLKLRLLIRQSEVPGFDPAPEIAKMTVGVGGPLNILRSGESVMAQPGFVNETNKQSPYYANYGFTPTGADANTSTRANVYIVDHILKPNNDPRLLRFFDAVGSTVVGTTFGASTGNPTGAQSSKMGDGLAGTATQDAWILPSFLSMFWEAEAIARGWVTGDAQTAYENAVRESFIWLGVPNAVTAANNYMANVASANWANSGATAIARARFIAFQKYIALTGIDPVEAWSDLRRLNMIPDDDYITVNPGRISNTLPVRLLYPQTEYTANGENVGAQGTINLFTSKIFWQP
jgi:hypothetical protein